MFHRLVYLAKLRSESTVVGRIYCLIFQEHGRILPVDLLKHGAIGLTPCYASREQRVLSSQNWTCTKTFPSISSPLFPFPSRSSFLITLLFLFFSVLLQSKMNDQENRKRRSGMSRHARFSKDRSTTPEHLVSGRKNSGPSPSRGQRFISGKEEQPKLTRCISHFDRGPSLNQMSKRADRNIPSWRGNRNDPEDEQRRKERKRRMNTENARRLREKQKLELEAMEVAHMKNEERILYLERMVEELSSELRRHNTFANHGERRPMITQAFGGGVPFEDIEERPGWFGTPF